MSLARSSAGAEGASVLIAMQRSRALRRSATSSGSLASYGSPDSILVFSDVIAFGVRSASFPDDVPARGSMEREPSGGGHAAQEFERAAQRCRVHQPGRK